MPGRGETGVKLIKFVTLCLVALTAAPVFAQDSQSDPNMQILLDKVKADKGHKGTVC
jgi:hypothetical protein